MQFCCRQSVHYYMVRHGAEAGALYQIPSYRCVFIEQRYAAWNIWCERLPQYGTIKVPYQGSFHYGSRLTMSQMGKEKTIREESCWREIPREKKGLEGIINIAIGISGGERQTVYSSIFKGTEEKRERNPEAARCGNGLCRWKNQRYKPSGAVYRPKAGRLLQHEKLRGHAECLHPRQLWPGSRTDGKNPYVPRCARLKNQVKSAVGTTPFAHKDS